MMRRTDVQGADVEVHVFETFSTFRYGDENELTTVFLTPAQTREMAKCFAEAVALHEQAAEQSGA